MDVDRAARQVVDAVARGRAERVITAHGKVIVFAQRHVPWLVSAIVRRFGVKSRPEARSARA
jgi:hypothetical protein